MVRRHGLTCVTLIESIRSSGMMADTLASRRRSITSFVPVIHNGRDRPPAERPGDQHPWKTMRSASRVTVLTRPIGTPAIMRGQLAELVDAAEAGHTVQVLPRAVGASPAVNGSFSIHTLPDPIPDFGHAESPGGSMYIEDREHVRALLEKWGIRTERALSPAESLDALNRRGHSRVIPPKGHFHTNECGFVWRKSVPRPGLAALVRHVVGD